MAELARWQATITDDAGNVVPLASVEVRSESVGALAALYSDRNGAASIANPATADADGFVYFHVTGGAYRIDASSGAFSKTWRYVAIGTAAEGDTSGTLPPQGLLLTFDSATTDVDPGQGQFRANHATFASITKLWIDNTDTQAISITSWLDALDDYGVTSGRGLLRAELRGDAVGQWAEFEVTGSVVDKTGYREITATPIASSNWPFTDAASVMFTFAHAGPQGTAGVSSPAVNFVFSTTTTDADPGAGKLRYNNATVASVTAIYADNAEAGGGTVTGWLDSFDDADAIVKGFLYISKVADPTKFAIFKVSGTVVDGTGYRKITVAHLSSNSTFSDLDTIQATFVPSADSAAGAGIRWTFDTSTSMADPGTGDIRLNNATVASVTAIALSANCAEVSNPSVLAYVNTFDDSGSTAYRGNLIIKKVGSPATFATFKVTGVVTDNTTWQQLAVTYVAGNGSFSSGDLLSLTFVPTGASASDMVLLTSGTIANSATSLDLVLTAYTAYRRIIIFGANWVPATDAVSLNTRFSTDGGSSYDAGASDYSWNATGIDDSLAAGAGTYRSNGDAADGLMSVTGDTAAGNVGNAATEGVSFTMEIYNQTNTASWPRFRAHGAYVNSAATPAGVQFISVGVRRAAQDVDAIRFLWSSGNFKASAPGTYGVYGMN